jgi:hypothetical protein
MPPRCSTKSKQFHALEKLGLRRGPVCGAIVRTRSVPVVQSASLRTSLQQIAGACLPESYFVGAVRIAMWLAPAFLAVDMMSTAAPR